MYFSVAVFDGNVLSRWDLTAKNKSPNYKSLSTYENTITSSLGKPCPPRVFRRDTRDLCRFADKPYWPGNPLSGNL